MSSNRKRVKIVYEPESTPAVDNSSDQVAAKKSKSFEPSKWQEVLQNIRDMRLTNAAPVDTMGCEKCYDENADDKTRRFQVLVSLMLSSQTKDEVTFAACQRLKKMGFTPQSLAVADFEELLKPVGFYKTKAKHIKAASKILIESYDGDIPDTIEGLLKLPGVGPKMAHICMKAAWNVVTGIGIDVHCHRIANRLHWVPKATKDPEKTRIELEKWLPHELWAEVNLLLVGFGQTICSAKNPKCSECLNKDLCPSSTHKSKK